MHHTIQTQPSEVSVSVVVPAYNAAHWIVATLQSLAAQELFGLEVIVVDDGSQDDTGAVAADFLASSPLRYRIIQQANAGVCVARNSGLVAANGEYVLFLDADDHLDPSCLPALYAQARATNADMVFCGYDEVTPAGSVIRQYGASYFTGVISGPEALRKQLRGDIWLQTDNCLHRRAALMQHALRYRPRCRYGEDLEFLHKALFHAERVACVPHTLAHYVQHPASVMHTVSPRRTDSLAAFRRVYTYLAAHGAPVSLLDAYKKYGVAVDTYNVVRDLAKAGYHPRRLARLLRNRKVREALRLFPHPGRGFNTWKRWGLARLMLHAPRVATALCRKLA